MGRITLLGDARPRPSPLPNRSGDDNPTPPSPFRLVLIGGDNDDDDDAAAAAAAAVPMRGPPPSGEAADGAPVEVQVPAGLNVVFEVSRLGSCARRPSSVSCAGMCCPNEIKKQARVVPSGGGGLEVK